MTEQQAINHDTEKTSRGRGWWKWPVRVLAGVGALTLVAIGAAWLAGPQKAGPVQFSADDMIDQIMLNTYGKYSPSEKGWMYVGEGRRTYVMRVIHRAKIVDAQGNEELYFLASGGSVEVGKDEPITGAFKVLADPAKSDGSLVQISQPFIEGLGTAALAAQDVRFEALSDKTFGWVVKASSPWTGEDATGFNVTNHVLAPSADAIAEVAAFPAVIHVEVGGGCAAAQARYADWASARSNQAIGPTPGQAPASSPAGAGGEAPDEAANEAADDEPPLRCSEATFSYKTGPVPEDGFVTFTVTGSGPINGEPLPARPWKLVFDHKSFSYLVPDELTNFYTGY
jgi:hypothetical protein